MQTIRELLKTDFEQRRARNPAFSLRAFARYLDLSPAQLSQMMSGKRPVTARMTRNLARRLGLSPVERLQLLKNSMPEFIEETAEFRSAAEMKLSEDKFQLIADWHHFAILSLTRTVGAKGDPRWIARRLGIPVEQAAVASERLVRLGLLSLKPRFKQIAEPLHVLSDTPSDAIRRFHKQNLQQAIEKVDTVPMAMRELQAVTMSFDARKMKRLREVIDEFINQAVAEGETSSAASDVYTLAVQFFPVTRSEGDSK